MVLRRPDLTASPPVEQARHDGLSAIAECARHAAGGSRGAGRKFRYLLAGIARCSECGGPLTVMGGRFDGRILKAYMCAYHRDRGEHVCRSALRRPVELVNGAVINWIHANVLSEEVVIATLRTIRERLAERSKAANSDLPQLRGEAERLRAEIDRLVAAIAAGTAAPKALVEAVAERQEQLSAVDARIRAAAAAREAIGIEVRRLEAQARKHIAELKESLAQGSCRLKVGKAG